MIIEYFLDQAIAFMGWIAGIFPDWNPPALLLNADDTVNDFFENFSGLGVWAPWGYVATCVGIALTTWLVAATIKLILKIAAFLPFIGGSG